MRALGLHVDEYVGLGEKLNAYPDELSRYRVAGDGALRGWIRQGIERAERHGVVEEDDIARFLELRTRLGPDLDAPATWEGRVLRRRDIGPAAKLARIERHAARAVQ